MSIFGKMFGDSSGDTNDRRTISWKMLNSSDQLTEVNELSESTPVIIFKHSTRCSISRMALKQFENHYDLSEDEAVPYFLDLLEFRSVSNEIAEKYDVVHQSPQILVINHGKCSYTSSHSEIDADEIASRIRSKAI